MQIFDCSIPLSSKTPAFPGDESFSLNRVAEFSAGDDVELSRFTASTHSGTHIDAPAHFIPGGKKLNEIPIERLVGKVQVIEILDTDCITLNALQRHNLQNCKRIFFKTRNSQLWHTHPHEFIQDFVYLGENAARYLAGLELFMVGIDYLSIDPAESKNYPAHIFLLEKEILIVEGIDLSEVSAGTYDLVCAPLKIENAEAAPARVLLLKN